MWHRYRIASVSKLITAMGIARLVRLKKLHYLSYVFGNEGILSDLCTACHPNIRIFHLLEHTSGAWPHAKRTEFARMDLNQTEFLREVVLNEAPLFYPGERHLYSNIGYLLLGEVIEKISGLSYEEFIRREILEPLNINGTIGKEYDLLEANYYSHDNANGYTSWSATRLGAAAGWALRPAHISLLFNHLERHRNDEFAWIVRPSPARRDYGMGVQISDGSLYHVGSLAGSEAVGYSRNGYQIGIATNVRGKEENEHTKWMLKLAKQISHK